MGWQCSFFQFQFPVEGSLYTYKKKLPINILDSFEDKEGNICAILAEIEGRKILIDGIYGPNTDNPNFYSNTAFKLIYDWNPDYSIYVGHWNVALNPDIDTQGYQSQNNPRARLEIRKQMNDLELLDVFRDLNPTIKKFTWKKWRTDKCARLDYFPIFNSLLPFVSKAEILSSCYSDHNPILLQRGRGFWKLNNSLLYDKDYVNRIKKIIKDVTCRFGLFASMWAFCLGLQFYPAGSLPFHAIIWVICLVIYCLLIITFMWALCSKFTCFDHSIELFAL